MKNKLSGIQENEFRQFLAQIAENIKKRRIDLSMRQEDIDLSPLPFDVRKYQRIEYGEENMTLQSIFILCKNLKMQPGQMLDQITIKID